MLSCERLRSSASRCCIIIKCATITAAIHCRQRQQLAAFPSRTAHANAYASARHSHRASLHVCRFVTVCACAMYILIPASLSHHTLRMPMPATPFHVCLSVCDVLFVFVLPTPAPAIATAHHSMYVCLCACAISYVCT